LWQKMQIHFAHTLLKSFRPNLHALSFRVLRHPELVLGCSQLTGLLFGQIGLFTQADSANPPPSARNPLSGSHKRTTLRCYTHWTFSTCLFLDLKSNQINYNLTDRMENVTSRMEKF
jgi:hypothetical protein